jgi:hypothetical protein
MLEEIHNVWLTLRGMNIYLEVIAAAFFAYFWLRGVKDINPKVSTWIPFIVSLIGQFAYEIQDNVAKKEAMMNVGDFVMAIFMAFFTGGAASMVYSMADKYGWIDKVGVAVGKKIPGDPTPPTT